LAFQFRPPEDEKNRLALKEQRVGTVVDVLTAKVPKVESDWAIETFQNNGLITKLNAMGG
jgi:hypothetical protein